MTEAPLLEMTAADYCVHHWQEQPQIDLQDPGRTVLPRVWECRKCRLGLKGGSRSLPNIGRRQE